MKILPRRSRCGDAGVGLARAVRRMEGAGETRICGRVDEVAGRAAAAGRAAVPREGTFISERQVADVLRAETPGVCGGFPRFFDRDLHRLFAVGPAATPRVPASRFLRAHRQRILAAVGAWTGGKKYTVNQLVRDLSQRCDKLELQAGADDPALLVQVTAYLTALVTNYLFTGKFKRTK